VGFELRGYTILSYGEHMELIRSMHPNAQVPSALVAWFAGEQLSPQTLQTALERSAVHVADDRGHEILSLAARRLREALGRGEFDFDPLPPPEPGEL
jgi:hypothetical protein